MKAKRKPCQACHDKGWIHHTAPDNTVEPCGTCNRFDSPVTAAIAFLQANPLYNMVGIVVQRFDPNS